MKAGTRRNRAGWERALPAGSGKVGKLTGKKTRNGTAVVPDQPDNHSSLEDEKGQAHAPRGGQYTPFTHEAEEGNVDGEEQGKQPEDQVCVGVGPSLQQPGLFGPAEGCEYEKHGKNPAPAEM